MSTRALSFLLAFLLGFPSGSAWTFCACGPTGGATAAAARQGCCAAKRGACASGGAERCASGRGAPGPGLIDPDACGCVRVASPATVWGDELLPAAAPGATAFLAAPPESPRVFVAPAAATPRYAVAKAAPFASPPPRLRPLLI